MNVEDESKGGLIGGFGDEPMALPAFEMSNGPVPGFMIKEQMGQGADDMEIKRLESTKLRISKINDIASVKVSQAKAARNTFIKMFFIFRVFSTSLSR